MVARRLYVPEAMPTRDANGRALPAKLRFYAPGSALDTLKPVYSDDTLTVPLAQPVLSDAAGQFPAIFADDAELFDVGHYDQAFGRQLGTWENVAPATYVLTDGEGPTTLVVNVADYGAVGDGVTDDTLAIQAAIDENPARRIFLPNGSYLVTSTIWLKYSGQTLEGEAGGGYTFLQTDDSYSTSLVWGGTAGGTVLKVAHHDSSVAPNSISGACVKSLRIECNGTNRAGVGMWVPDASLSVFEHIKIDGASSRCLDLTAFVPDVAGINSVYQCAFRDIAMYAFGSGDGIYMGDTVNVGGGDHPAFVTFDNVHITWENGLGINIYEADDITFDNIGMSRRAGGTGGAIRLRDDGAGGPPCGLHFRCLNVSQTDGAAPPITVEAGCRAIYFEMSGIDTGIGPTIEAGAECFVMYLGSNTTANTAYFRSPPIKLPNAERADPLALDWYEEATFTPTLLVNALETGITYSARSGSFTRIGRVVTAAVDLTVSSIGASVGAVTIGGLPYQPSTTLTGRTGDVRKVSGWPAGMNGVRVLASTAGVVLPRMILLKDTAASGVQSLAETDIANGFRIQVSITYEV